MKCTVFIGFLLIGLCLADVPEIPDLDDLEDLKDRCNTKGGPGTFDKVKTAKSETETCLKKLINVDKFQIELEEAKRTGSMDEVFAKYCEKRPEILDCVKKTYNAVEPCLEENESGCKFHSRYFEQLSDFACFKDGDRLAMFVAEGGIECIQSRSEGIKSCLNQTLKFNPATFSPNSILDFTIDKKKCDDMKTVQDCVVKDLEENCEDTTPANIVDALFRFVKKITCKDVKQRRSISLKRHIRSTLMDDSFRTEIETKMKEKCKENGNEQSFDKLKESVIDAMGCMRNHRVFVTPIDAYDNALVNCSTSAKKAFEDCLAESEKYYPDFALQSMRNLLKFAYKNSDLVLGKITDWEFAVCMKDLSREENKEKMMKCLKDSTKDAKFDYFSVPTKPELCEQTETFDSCIQDIIKNTCVKDIKIDKLVESFITALESPCTETTIDNEA
ncbi:hypothetical protein JTB14_003297 [Gonioctena quinquepunctata]|nr:hypothetical protein JTB14_003297 [Gonioctena quinquepunctata]